MHEQTRHDFRALLPVSRDPGPLDLTAPSPPNNQTEQPDAVEKMSRLGQTLFAHEEIQLERPPSLPTFSELVAQAYRSPSPVLQHLLHEMVEMPGLDTAARHFNEE